MGNSIYRSGAMQTLSPQESLAQSVTTLSGVTPRAGEILKDLGIATIQDLASSSIFSIASQIEEAAKPIDELKSFKPQTLNISTDIINKEGLDVPIERLALKPVGVLAPVGFERAKDIATELGINTIGELAHWPPYVTARDILSDSVGGIRPFNIEDPEAPSYLIPGVGKHPTERVHYDAILLDRVLGQENLNLTPIEQVSEPLEIVSRSNQEFTRPALGALLRYTQSWYTLGLTLGQLLHSVALSPGETTRIAIIDWNRQERAGVTEETRATENLQAIVGSNRSINEVTNAVANEAQQGFSNSFTGEHTFSGGTGTGVGGEILNFAGVAGVSIGASFGMTMSNSSSYSTGHRDVSSNMAQTISDVTQQAANSVRNRRASVVREVSQHESEMLSTRAITNFNHMHALTVQYYEVVQLYKTAIEIAQEPTRCLFLPMKILDFSNLDVLHRHRSVLRMAALTTDVRDALSDDATTTIAGKGTYAESYKANAAKLLEEAQLASHLQLSSQSGAPSYWRVPRDTESTGFYVTCSPSTSGTLIQNRADGTIERSQLQSGGTGAAWGWNLDSKLSKLWSSFDLELSLDQASGVKPPFDVTIELNLDCWGHDFQYRFVRLVSEDEIGAPIRLLTISPPPWESSVVTHLQENALYYSQAIWRSMSGPTLVAQMKGFSFQNKPIAAAIDPTPLTVIGNYVVFRYYGEDEYWQQFLLDHQLDSTSRIKARREDIIPLPSGGVFAEAVLGRFNSAEKLDITRFWNWQDSPIPITAPEIAPLQAGSRAQPVEIKSGELGQPVLNLINAPAMPDPTGTASVLNAIANGNMFRDMSNTAETIAAASAALAGGFTAGSKSQEIAANYAQMAAALKMNSKNSSSSSKPTSPQTVSNSGARINYGETLDKRNGVSNGYVDSTGKRTGGYATTAFEGELGILPEIEYTAGGRSPAHTTGVSGADGTTPSKKNAKRWDTVSRWLEYIIPSLHDAAKDWETNPSKAFKDVVEDAVINLIKSAAKAEGEKLIDSNPYTRAVRIAVEYAKVFADGIGVIMDENHNAIQRTVDAATQFDGTEGLSDEDIKTLIEARQWLWTASKELPNVFLRGLIAVVNKAVNDAFAYMGKSVIDEMQNVTSGIAKRLIDSSGLTRLATVAFTEADKDTEQARLKLYNTILRGLATTFIAEFGDSKRSEVIKQCLTVDADNGRPEVALLRGYLEIGAKDLISELLKPMEDRDARNNLNIELSLALGKIATAAIEKLRQDGIRVDFEGDAVTLKLELDNQSNLLVRVVIPMKYQIWLSKVSDPSTMDIQWGLAQAAGYYEGYQDLLQLALDVQTARLQALIDESLNPNEASTRLRGGTQELVQYADRLTTNLGEVHQILLDALAETGLVNDTSSLLGPQYTYTINHLHANNDKTIYV